MDASTDPGPLLYLDRATVRRLLPPVDELLDHLARTYVEMARGRVENPAKIGVHPRPDAFLHAMPAHLAAQDVTALKWVSAFPGNRRAGLPTIAGLVVLNDSATGLPVAVMDATEITAVRTAVASGVSIRHLAHPGWSRVGMLGYGEQGRQHAAVVRALNPYAEIRVYGGPRLVGPQPGVQVVAEARAAVEGADVVVTAVPMTKRPEPVVERAWLPARCLVVPVDFDASVPPSLVDTADDFVVDDEAQFAHYRALGSFAGWRAPARSLGAALQEEPRGDLRVSCSLGVGAVDAAVAALVRQRAEQAGAGTALPR